ncbi:MAG: oxidoreductase [Bacteroidia bacterium]|nr:oxidoreductase [Bacteroidia bacterium]
MQSQKLSMEGPSFSRIVAGAWRWTLEQAQVEQLIQASLENDITTFDHADIYGDYSNEEIFGRVLKNASALRDQMQIVTKCGIRLLSAKRPEHKIKHYDTSRQHIVNSVEASLKNLATDHIDLLLIHRPDPLLDPAVVAETFSLLRQSGKVLHFGVSNFTTSQFDVLQAYMPTPLVTNQLEISLFHHQLLFDGTVDGLMREGIAPMAWSPLGGGKPFGEQHGLMQQLEGIARKYEANVSQLLMAWLLRHPSRMVVVAGTTKTERIREAAEATRIELDRQDWFEMLKLVRGADVP